MKKLCVLLLTAMMVFSFVSCEQPKAETVTVTIKVTGAEDQTVTVEKGSSYTLPEAPTVDGHFQGWLVNDAEEATAAGTKIKVDANTTITASIKYIATDRTKLDAMLANPEVGTIYLGSDMEGQLTIKRSLVIDLDGHTITGTGDESTNQSAVRIDESSESVTVTVKNGKMVGKHVVVIAKQSGDVDFTVDNVEINYKPNAFGITANGSTGGGKRTVTVKNSKILTEKDGDNDPTGCGIYISNTKDNAIRSLNVENSTINGCSAIEIKHTNATIKDSVLSTIWTKEKVYTMNGGGSCTSGYLVALTNNTTSTTATDTITGSIVVDGVAITETTNDYYIVK